MFISLGALKKFEFGDGLWHCRISMPCSYQQGDGIRCDVEASGQTKDEASEHACLRVLAHILAENYASVRLIPKHWNIPLTELHERVDDVLSRRASHQPLAYEEPGGGQTPSGAEVAASEPDCKEATSGAESDQAHAGDCSESDAAPVRARQRVAKRETAARANEARANCLAELNEVRPYENPGGCQTPSSSSVAAESVLRKMPSLINQMD